MLKKNSLVGLKLLICLLMIAWLHGYAQSAGAQQIVYPTNTLADPVNVQTAVNLGGTIILKATNESGTPTPFYFGEPAKWLTAGDASNNARRVAIVSGNQKDTRFGHGGSFVKWGGT